MSYTHTAHTCSSPFLGAFLAYEGIGHRSRPRDPHSSGPATATAHVRVQLAEYDSMDMPDVQNPFLSRAHDPPNDSMPMRCEHGGPQPQSSGNRGSASSMANQPTPTTAAATTRPSANMPTSSRRCCCPPSSCSHHLAHNLPNAGIMRGGEHGSFIRGREASSSMKGCSLAMNLRCVAPVRHSAR